MGMLSLLFFFLFVVLGICVLFSHLEFEQHCFPPMMFNRTFYDEGRVLSVLFSTVATTHMWLWSSFMELEQWRNLIFNLM